LRNAGGCHALVYPAIVLVFVAAMVIFVGQSALVTMWFLGFGVPASLVVYVLGVITSGSLYAILRKSVRKSQLTRAR
jgi:hypothetical protein